MNSSEERQHQVEKADGRSPQIEFVRAERTKEERQQERHDPVAFVFRGRWLGSVDCGDRTLLHARNLNLVSATRARVDRPRKRFVENEELAALPAGYCRGWHGGVSLLRGSLPLGFLGECRFCGGFEGGDAPRRQIEVVRFRRHFNERAFRHWNPEADLTRLLCVPWPSYRTLRGWGCLLLHFRLAFVSSAERKWLRGVFVCDAELLASRLVEVYSAPFGQTANLCRSGPLPQLAIFDTSLNANARASVRRKRRSSSLFPLFGLRFCHFVFFNVLTGNDLRLFPKNL